MSEGTIVAAKPKEGTGSTSIQCPMLNSTNYTVWALKMKIALKVHKVWEAIEPETEEADEDKNNMAMALLFQSISEALVLQIGDLDTTKKVWDAIKSRHVGAERVKEARQQTLMADFERLKMKDSEKIDEFAGKMSELASKSASLGVAIDESKMVKKFLNCLPHKKFIHIVASLEHVLDLNTTTFEDIIGRLKAYEERIIDAGEVQEDQSKLMYANMETQNSREYTNDYRNVEELQEAQVLDTTNTQDGDELMMHEVVFLNEKRCIPSKFETNMREDNIWYLGNGASNHMTGDKRYFEKMDESVTGKVRFGDDSRVDIKGKGSISLVDMYGEL
ncbi:PREDICTED: uncharacterized protein LOC104749335 [Camelina sativa]|uniref:Uncharacterized protein LOC104749335 n=1 Tax=Camelina sativa TaxID=90675 RepID=A0ABM0WCU7_CAMSA|nr:PREDICTED: uncharacterized protein LOC104749335 [Camelina sativa]